MPEGISWERKAQGWGQIDIRRSDRRWWLGLPMPEGKGFSIHRLQTLLPMPEGFGLAVYGWHSFFPLSEDAGFPVCRWQLLPHMSEDICFVICQFDCRIRRRPKTMVSRLSAMAASTIARRHWFVHPSGEFVRRCPKTSVFSFTDRECFCHCPKALVCSSAVACNGIHEPKSLDPWAL